MVHPGFAGGDPASAALPCSINPHGSSLTIAPLPLASLPLFLFSSFSFQLTSFGTVLNILAANMFL